MWLLPDPRNENPAREMIRESTLVSWQYWSPALDERLRDRRRPFYSFYLLPTFTMVIKRRTVSLLRPPNQQSAGRPSDPSSSATDPDAIRRGNWNSWRAYLRIVATTLCIVSIACIAWAYDHSPKGEIDHYVSDGQDVPWVLIPVRLHPIPTLKYSSPPRNP